MKALTLLCTFALAFASSPLAAQEVASITTPTYASEASVDTNNAPTTPPAVISSKQASAALNGGMVQVQTLPESSTVLVSYTLPMRDDWGTIELADAESGKVIFSGTVLVRDGQVELPVTNAATAYEVRLSTDHDMLIARMTN